jgi:hypothetical protein
MRNKALIAGFMALTLAPGAVLAQPYDPGCVRSNQDNHAAGTILGAIGGAILGSAIAGRGSHGAGAVIGGVGGAVAGNAIAGSNDHPCPTGYYYAPPPPPPEEAGFWRDAPHGLHERIDFIQSRIDRSAQSGWLAPREIDRLNHELSDVRYQDRSLHDRDGSPLPPADLQYLQSRLDHIAGELHWMEHNGG